MHRAAENAAEHDPEQGGRPVQRPKDGADHRAEPGDVQKLDEKNLVAGQFNVVHAVAPAFDRRETPEISSEHFFHECAVHEVPAEQQREAAPEIP